MRKTISTHICESILNRNSYESANTAGVRMTTKDTLISRNGFGISSELVRLTALVTSDPLMLHTNMLKSMFYLHLYLEAISQNVPTQR